MSHVTNAPTTPRIPRAPKEYNSGIFEQIVNSVNFRFNLLETPGIGRHTELVLTDITGDGHNKEVGSLYYGDGGVLKVVLPGITYVIGEAATGSLGSDTVTTT